MGFEINPGESAQLQKLILDLQDNLLNKSEEDILQGLRRARNPRTLDFLAEIVDRDPHAVRDPGSGIAEGILEEGGPSAYQVDLDKNPASTEDRFLVRKSLYGALQNIVRQVRPPKVFEYKISKLDTATGLGKDVFERPDRYYIFPILTQQGSKFIAQPGQEGSASAISNIVDAYKIPSGFELPNPKDGLLQGFILKTQAIGLNEQDIKSMMEKTTTYQINSNYFYFWETGGTRIPVLIVPKYHRECPVGITNKKDIENYVPGSVRLRLPLAPEDAPLFLDILGRIPGEVCSDGGHFVVTVPKSKIERAIGLTMTAFGEDFSVSEISENEKGFIEKIKGYIQAQPTEHQQGIKELFQEMLEDWDENKGASREDLTTVGIIGAFLLVHILGHLFSEGYRKTEATVLASAQILTGGTPEYLQNIVKKVEEGEVRPYDSSSGEREEIIHSIMRVLARSPGNKRSVILLGDSGQGKTAIMEEIARRIHVNVMHQENPKKYPAPDPVRDFVNPRLLSSVVFSMSFAGFGSDIKYLGEFEGKVKLFAKWYLRHSESIIYGDEAQKALGLGETTKDEKGSRDLMNHQLEDLRRGRVRWVLSTTTEQFENLFKAYDARVGSAFLNRFEIIVLDNYTPSEVRQMLKKIVPDMLPKDKTTRISDVTIDALVNQLVEHRTKSNELLLRAIETISSAVELYNARIVEGSITVKDNSFKALLVQREALGTEIIATKELRDGKAGLNPRRRLLTQKIKKLERARLQVEEQLQAYIKKNPGSVLEISEEFLLKEYEAMSERRNIEKSDLVSRNLKETAKNISIAVNELNTRFGTKLDVPERLEQKIGSEDEHRALQRLQDLLSEVRELESLLENKKDSDPLFGQGKSKRPKVANIEAKKNQLEVLLAARGYDPEIDGAEAEKASERSASRGNGVAEAPSEKETSSTNEPSEGTNPKRGHNPKQRGYLNIFSQARPRDQIPPDIAAVNRVLTLSLTNAAVGAVPFAIAEVVSNIITGHENPTLPEFAKTYAGLTMGGGGGRVLVDGIIRMSEGSSFLAPSALPFEASKTPGKAFARRTVPLFLAITLADAFRTGRVDWQGMPLAIANIMAASGMTQGLANVLSKASLVRKIGVALNLVKAATLATAPETGGATLLGTVALSIVEFTILKVMGELEQMAVLAWTENDLREEYASAVRATNALMASQRNGDPIRMKDLLEAQQSLYVAQLKYEMFLNGRVELLNASFQKRSEQLHEEATTHAAYTLEEASQSGRSRAEWREFDEERRGKAYREHVASVKALEEGEASPIPMENPGRNFGVSEAWHLAAGGFMSSEGSDKVMDGSITRQIQDQLPSNLSGLRESGEAYTQITNQFWAAVFKESLDEAIAQR